MRKAFIGAFIFTLIFINQTMAVQSISRNEKGKIVKKATKHGEFIQYIPSRISSKSRFVVLVHGSLGKDERAIDLAKTFTERWVDVAKRKGHILIAPAFDQRSYGGRAGPGGGYRGLFGRIVGADEFINEIVDSYKPYFQSYDGKFYLYGHSAGGQLVSRYAVMHPKRIIAAVISAAGTFAFPDPDIEWPNGMLPLNRTMQWSEDREFQKIDIQPNPDNWLKTSLLPIHVVVGRNDSEIIKAIPGQKGRTHLERATLWVNDMNHLAQKNKLKSNVSLKILDGIGHNSQDLMHESRKLLLR